MKCRFGNSRIAWSIVTMQIRARSGVRTTLLLLILAVMLGSAANIALAQANSKDELAPWKADFKVAPVSANDHHSIHAYFNTSPESPDGRWILYYASITADSHDGE